MFFQACFFKVVFAIFYKLLILPNIFLLVQIGQQQDAFAKKTVLAIEIKS